MKMDELKEWRTQNSKHKVATVLIMDGTSFSYTEEDGIVFSAPSDYVANLKRRLVNVYGLSVSPVFTEI